METASITILIGTYTSGDSEGIYQVSFNPKIEAFENLKLVATASNPSYLAISSNGENVYAVNENEKGSVQAYNRDASGALDLLDSCSTQGIHPCHLALDPSESLIAIANYSSGNVMMAPVHNEGFSSPVFVQHSGKGSHSRQEGPHAHYVRFSSDGRYLYAVDLGIDAIKLYDIQNAKIIGERIAFETQSEDGPRHLAFHPDQNWVYILNELDGSVVACQIQQDGSFQFIDRKSILPDDFDAENTAADIHISPNGRYCYASNRGHNSLAIFEILVDGSLQLLGYEQRGISIPRGFRISNDGKYLFVGNQDRDTVVAFKIGSDGLLTPIGQPLNVGNPVCLVLL